MKMRLTIIFLLISLSNVFSQYDAFTYQGLLLDASHNPSSNVSLEFTVSISSDPAGQDIYFQEQHILTSDENGVLAFNVGNGAALEGSFDDIDWLAGVPFINVEYDLGDNNGIRSLGTQEFNSVLFCLESKYVTCEDGPDGPAGPQGPEGPQSHIDATGQTGATGAQGPAGPEGNPIMTQLDAVPMNPYEGFIYLDTGTNRYDNKPGFRYFDGTDWIDLG